MNFVKRSAAVLLCAALLICTAACTPKFAEYDVSAYVQALLDSTYHSEHGDLQEITGTSLADAQENNDTTVANAAVLFCNTYGISPNESQLAEFEMIMRQAFALTKYTVKEERQVETGYYLEVEVAAITNFKDCGDKIESIKQEVQGGTVIAGESADPAESDTEDDESTPTESTPQTTTTVGSADANERFVQKVLDFCKQELANISYDTDTISLPLDILQTEDGELQIDLNQLEAIDRAVIRF